MNTFWGCETEALTELSDVFGLRAVRLRTVVQGAAQAVRTAAWTGPDAEEHRLRTQEMVESAAGLLERLRALGELMGAEAEAQEICSQPEEATGPATDPLGVRAVPPWVQDPFERVPRLSGPGDDGWGPMIGGPFAAKDPVALADRLPDLPDLGGIGPWIGGPLMAEDPLRPIPAPRPVPEGEEFALDPEVLAAAEQGRKRALRAVPGVGTVQMLMGLHTGAGAVLDQAEQSLEGSGLGAFAPVLDVARAPHTIAGVALGEESILGQTASGIDRSIANVMQTGDEVSTAIGDGDIAGALRAGERGMYRHAGAMADIATATALPAFAGATSEVLGTGADMVGLVSPEAAAPLHEASELSGEVGRLWEQDRARLTDAEQYYDLRRKYLSTPWDQRG